MNLQRINGQINNLRIVRAKQNVAFGPQMREAAGLTAIVFSVAEMGGASVQTSLNANAAAEDVTLYSFDVAGECFAGCTREATFESGDNVEVVFERRCDGNEVIALRRPSTRSIWLYPYMSRGSGAAIRHGVILWLLWSVGVLIPILLIWLAMNTVSGHIRLASLLVVSVGSFAFVVVLGVLGVILGAKFLRFSHAAEEVFAAFGYPDPKVVDLGKTSKAHRKAHGIPWTWENKSELWY